VTTETDFFASDQARDRATELGLGPADFADAKPTGAAGGFTKSDVEKLAESREAAADESSGAGAEALADWPSKGYDGEQPWEVVDPYSEEARRLHEEPGSPNDVAPIVLTHSHPILTSGSGGVEVAELAQKLAALGYRTSISRGENPFATLDPSVMAAVNQFRDDYGVREDPGSFGGEEIARNHVGPYTWEALDRAVERAS
jgi:hypothetical protein